MDAPAKCGRWRPLLLGLAIATTGGCAGGKPSPGVGAPAATSTAPKTLVIGVLGGIPTFAPWDSTNPSSGGPALTELHVNGLVTNDAVGGLEPRLASKMPSGDDGTIVFLPDGRMRTVWSLRSNVKWHDGEPFTANDMVFTWEALNNRDTPSTSGRKWVQLIDSVVAEDPLTLAVTWKNSYYGALDIGQRVFWPLPRHLLAETLRRDADAFKNSTYWTTEYVHLGPFRLEQLSLEGPVFQRFDDYFLGRPKLDRVIVKVVGDGNGIVTYLKAGVLDIAAESALPPEAGASLREEWQSTGKGKVLFRPQSWHYLHFQMDPLLARPVELSQDVRVRRALFQSVDRQNLRAFLYPGLPDISADSFLSPKDARRVIAGEPFARYPYDPGIAARLLEEGGWLRGADGHLVDRQGQQFEIQIRAEERDAHERAIIADSFRAMGILPREASGQRQDSADLSPLATFPGLDSTGRTTGPGVLVYFQSREAATPENRWAGQNKNHYANGAVDDLIDRLYETVDNREQVPLIKAIGDILADDMPIMPLYFRTLSAAVVRGVRALDDFGGSDSGTMSRNAHLWDRD